MLAAAAPIRPLTWEILYATDAARKERRMEGRKDGRKKKEKKRKKVIYYNIDCRSRVCIAKYTPNMTSKENLLLGI